MESSLSRAHMSSQASTKPMEEQHQGSPRADLHLAVIEEHPIHGLDGPSCCLLSLKMNKAMATGSIFITDHLQSRAGEKKIHRRWFSSSLHMSKDAELCSGVCRQQARDQEEEIKGMWGKKSLPHPHGKHRMLLPRKRVGSQRKL